MLQYCKPQICYSTTNGKSCMYWWCTEIDMDLHPRFVERVVHFAPLGLHAAQTQPSSQHGCELPGKTTRPYLEVNWIWLQYGSVDQSWLLNLKLILPLKFKFACTYGMWARNYATVEHSVDQSCSPFFAGYHRTDVSEPKCGVRRFDSEPLSSRPFRDYRLQAHSLI